MALLALAFMHVPGLIWFAIGGLILANILLT
jgi:hypothetical protein